MSQFLKWLVESTHSNTQIQKLADLAKRNADDWKGVTNELEARQVIKNDTKLSESDQKEYIEFTSAAWASFNNPSASLGPPKAHQRLTHFLVENAPIFIIGILAIGLFGLLVRVIWVDEFLESLGTIERVRGLITFFFALGTVGVAIILVAAVFTNDAKDLKERFDMGKQVLTALIGILGTIVGFYFGAEFAEKPKSSANTTENGKSGASKINNNAQQKLKQAAQRPADKKPQAGGVQTEPAPSD